MVIVEVIETKITDRILVSPIGIQSLNKLHSALLIPIADGNRPIPPNAVIQFVRS